MTPLETFIVHFWLLKKHLKKINAEIFWKPNQFSEIYCPQLSPKKAFFKFLQIIHLSLSSLLFKVAHMKFQPYIKHSAMWIRKKREKKKKFFTNDAFVLPSRALVFYCPSNYTSTRKMTTVFRQKNFNWILPENCILQGLCEKLRKQQILSFLIRFKALSMAIKFNSHSISRKLSLIREMEFLEKIFL